jgi:hypothetical protein|uniref:Uncharacterized protein n=1 Tax=Phaeodactylum tricornutum TaxID=2850 RepID=A0A8J9S728_PHATR
MKHRNLNLVFFLILSGICCFDAAVDETALSSAVNESTKYFLSGKDILLPAKWLFGTLKKLTIGPFIEPLAMFTAKVLVVAFVNAEILAYLGLIGDRGEGLYEWALDNDIQVHRWIDKYGLRPGGFVRGRLEQMLTSYKKMSAKARFASAVTTGTAFFPLTIKTTVWLGIVVIATFVVAEMLAFVGLIGDPGEGIDEWLKDGDAEPILRTFRRGTSDLRRILRRKLKISELLSGYINSIKDDFVFWIGYSIGGLACVTLRDAPHSNTPAP